MISPRLFLQNFRESFYAMTEIDIVKLKPIVKRTGYKTKKFLIKIMESIIYSDTGNRTRGCPDHLKEEFLIESGRC